MLLTGKEKILFPCNDPPHTFCWLLPQLDMSTSLSSTLKKNVYIISIDSEYHINLINDLTKSFSQDNSCYLQVMRRLYF